MRFASLGSGSEGNALVVGAGATLVMIDCGFGLRDTVRRLARLDIAPEAIDAILITHEHSDHLGGAAAFAGKYGIPVWLTHGTHEALNGKGAALHCRIFDSHDSFAVDDLCIQPVPVPHDAREPVQFVVGDGCHRLGVLTDTGSSTAHIEAQLSGCDALVLECNHDSDMLRQGPYPYYLKQRIGGRFGHLHNAAAAALLSAIDCSRLQHIVAAHLSRHNNHPGKVRAALAGALGCTPEWIAVAGQSDGFDWRAL